MSTIVSRPYPDSNCSTLVTFVSLATKGTGVAGHGAVAGEESREVGTNPTDLALDLAGLKVNDVDTCSQPELASERGIEISRILVAGAAVSLRTRDACNAEELDPSDPGEISRL
mgnify:CR=1 FL=1